MKIITLSLTSLPLLVIAACAQISNQTKVDCVTKSQILEGKDTKPIVFNNETITESGIISSNQVLAYSFDGTSKQQLSYTTNQNICISIYTPDNQLIESSVSPIILPINGKYIIQVSAPKDSTSFDLTMNLKSVTKLSIPASVASKTSVPAPVASKTSVPAPVPSKTSVPAPVPSETSVPAPVPFKTSVFSSVPFKTPVPAPVPSKTSVPSSVPSKTPVPAPVPSKTSVPAPVPSKTSVPAPVPSKTPVRLSVASKTPDPSSVPSETLVPLSVPSLPDFNEPVIDSQTESKLRPNADDFVRDYYIALKNRQYEQTWNSLSPGFQSISGSSSQYEEWWNSVTEINIGDIKLIDQNTDKAVVDAELSYVLEGGRIYEDGKKRIYLIWNDDTDSWLFNRKLAP
ncbi:hypothetical protein NWP30_03385 [Chrysosporum ovalisporum CS-1034]|uniref:hypothetical protein n=1 Tax=Umezakia ovalisporum TaxID=75695 RepID=UPI002474E99D|nr:hypothetical protein [Umezakia ovalisporum]MDH6073415.1 hypothetical protein [Umezakia ovalisporum CS-1034]MDH6076562.1 hypothetical protein [Umezakia ovalisporum FSS-45]